MFDFNLLPFIPARYWMVFAFFAGLLFGSFANVVIYRLQKKQSIVKPPSYCPACNKKLKPIDLIPIVSWVFLRRRCRYCKQKISARYPMVELICGLLFASMVSYTSLLDYNHYATLSAIPMSIFALLLLIISFIDWDTQEIYDGLVILGAVVGVTWVGLGHFFPYIFPHAPAWYDALLGVVAGAAPLLIIDRITLLVIKKDGFGYGDVKLMAMVGLFLGWRLTLGAFPFGVLASFPLAIYFMVKRKMHTGDEEFSGYMAFGPFLCIGVIGVMWFGEWVVRYLLGM